MPRSSAEANKIEEINNENFKLKFFLKEDLAMEVVSEGSDTKARRVKKDYAKQNEELIAKLKRTLEGIRGVSDIKIDEPSRTATFKLNDRKWNETLDIQNKITKNVVSYFLSPAPIIVSLTEPRNPDKASLARGLIGTTGVRHAHLLPAKAEVQMDVESGSLEDVLQLFLDNGYKVRPTTHHLVRVNVTGEGNSEQLMKKFDTMKGTLSVKMEGESVTLLCAGKVKKDQLKKLVKQCGYKLDGKIRVR